MEKNRNEIDIIEFLLKIYLILRKHLIFIIIPLALGIVYTVIKEQTKADVYGSNMVLKIQPEEEYMYTVTMKEFLNKYDKNPVEIVEKIMKEASDFRANGNYELLSERMKLPVEKIKQIKYLGTSYRYEKGEAYSELITINAKTTNPELFLELNQGIINLINSNRYVESKHLSDSILLSNLISKLDNKIKELDSVQKQLLKKGIYQSNITIVGEFSIFAESVQLTALKEKLILKLSRLQRAEIVEPFYKPGSAEKSFKKDLIINSILSIFIGLIIILFKIVNQKANRYQKTGKL